MHEKWIKLAEELGKSCVDPNAQIGCVLVKDDEEISRGWNHVPTGVQQTDERCTMQPAKYFWVEHAERIAVFAAARNGVCTAGATAYVNVTPSSVCTLCVRGLVEAGITRIVGNTEVLITKHKTKTHNIVNEKMIAEAGIETLILDSTTKNKN